VSHWRTEPFNPIIPIIFKSKENLDNNYKKTIKNGPFIGYSETSDLIRCGPLIEIQQRDSLIYYTHHSVKTPAYNIWVIYRMSDSSYTKWQISVFSAFIFILVVHPYTYGLTQSVFGGVLGQIANASGCPTMRGLLLHTIVYILLVRGSMDLKLF
jgi:hypothetical protein